jgi:SNF related kinase
LAIQDRLAAESDRIKKQQETGGVPPTASTTTKGLTSLGGVTHVRSDMGATKEKLGAAGTGLYRKKAEFRPRTAGVLAAAKYKPMLSMLPSDGRSNSVDKYCGMKSIKDLESVNTKFITDSSTISIPLTGQTPTVIEDPMPKYKTMPSPTRGGADNCFNDDDDIAGECETVKNGSGGGESVTTISVTTTTNVTTHRRTKFHKARTASCSSSDASDDDSENRKKRAHKIVDGALKPLPQRRDSHDDSSDSQDAASSGNAANSCGGGKLTIRISSSSTQDTSGQKNSTGGGGGSSNNDGGSRKNNQQLDFRRHRTGRRRPGETRLRESQSLNRITEVQESEASISVAPLASPIPMSPISIDPPEIVSNPPFPRTKAKGLSARILQTFKKHDTNHNNNNNNSSHNNNNHRSKHEPLIQDDPQSTHSEDLEMVLGVELAKAFKANEAKNAKATAPTKKIKILGRYFHVSDVYSMHDSKNKSLLGQTCKISGLIYRVNFSFWVFFWPKKASL